MAFFNNYRPVQPPAPHWIGPPLRPPNVLPGVMPPPHPAGLGAATATFTGGGPQHQVYQVQPTQVSPMSIPPSMQRHIPPNFYRPTNVGFRHPMPPVRPPSPPGPPVPRRRPMSFAPFYYQAMPGMNGLGSMGY